jgi:hypothetical protein
MSVPASKRPIACAPTLLDASSQYHRKHSCFADTGKTVRCYVFHKKQLFQNIIPAKVFSHHLPCTKALQVMHSTATQLIYFACIAFSISSATTALPASFRCTRSVVKCPILYWPYCERGCIPKTSCANPPARTLFLLPACV